MLMSTTHRGKLLPMNRKRPYLWHITVVQWLLCCFERFLTLISPTFMLS